MNGWLPMTASAAISRLTQCCSALAAQFKLMLVEHLENLSSDRALIRHCQLRLDILFFLDYALNQPLPWHSTLSRTRQRLFDKVFDRTGDPGMLSI